MPKRILYRTESAYGSLVRDAVSVLTHEICELGNTDALEYCLQHHNLRKMHFDRTVRALIKSIDEGDCPGEDEVRLVVQDLLKHIESCTGISVNYALWLANRESVKTFYGGKESDIDAYECGPVILSDLDDEGILYGYTTLPQKI